MDELERRLTSMLTRAGERADPAAARLRNPAEAPHRRPARFGLGRLRTGWVVAAAGVAVVGVAVGIPQLSGHVAPAPITTPSTGRADGVHPLWPLVLATAPQQAFDRLPAGGPVDLPVPYTVDPQLVPDPTTDPTLVTAAGTIRFAAAGTKAVHLLAQRGPGTFIALTGAGHDGEDGLHDVRFELVAPDNTRREFYRATEAGSVTVSPDGTRLALSTWLGVADRQSEPAALIIDVRSGRVEHRLPGRFTQVSWASDDAVVLSGATSLAWRAPWTGPGEPVAVRTGTAITVAGGMVAVDETTGCLQRLAADATVTSANCHTWRSTGTVSPDGRYVSLEWTGADGSTHRGYLDVNRDEVRPWPVDGLNPSWLGATDVLLTEAGVEDLRATARCDLSTGACVRAPDDLHQGTWAGADWLGR
ncbi:hypothetical protein ACWKSP_02370 [Micromonosporaceae bacterium Da 78-11]